MWPTLVSAGPLIIRSFGVLLVLGLFFGGFVFWQKGREEGVGEEELMDCWLVAGAVSLIFSRTWWVLLNWDQFNNWYRILFLTKFPGLAYEGAWLGFWLAVVVYSLKKRWPVWAVLEAAVFSLLTVEIFCWLGQWLAAGNLKRPWELVWAAGLVLVYLILRNWEKKYRSSFKPGFLVSVYLVALGGLNFGLSFLSSGRRSWGLVLLTAGLLLLVNRWGKLTELLKTKVKKPTAAIKREVKRKKLGFDFK